MAGGYGCEKGKRERGTRSEKKMEIMSGKMLRWVKNHLIYVIGIF